MRRKNNKTAVIFVVFILVGFFFIIGYVSKEQAKNISDFPCTTWHKSHCRLCGKISLCEEGVKMLKIDVKNNNNSKQKNF